MPLVGGADTGTPDDGGSPPIHAGRADGGDPAGDIGPGTGADTGAAAPIPAAAAAPRRTGDRDAHGRAHARRARPGQRPGCSPVMGPAAGAGRLGIAAIALPRATTSSGCSMIVGATPSRWCSRVLTIGMRLDPPTRNIPAIWSGRTPARCRVLAVRSTVRCRYGRDTCSNSARVTCRSTSNSGTCTPADEVRDSCSFAVRTSSRSRKLRRREMSSAGSVSCRHRSASPIARLRPTSVSSGRVEVDPADVGQAVAGEHVPAAVRPSPQDGGVEGAAAEVVDHQHPAGRDLPPMTVVK